MQKELKNKDRCSIYLYSLKHSASHQQSLPYDTPSPLHTTKFHIFSLMRIPPSQQNIQTTHTTQPQNHATPKANII